MGFRRSGPQSRTWVDTWEEGQRISCREGGLTLSCIIYSRLQTKADLLKAHDSQIGVRSNMARTSPCHESWAGQELSEGQQWDNFKTLVLARMWRQLPSHAPMGKFWLFHMTRPCGCLMAETDAHQNSRNNLHDNDALTLYMPVPCLGEGYSRV